MKIATIVAAVALATGTAAFAADHSAYSDRDSTNHATVAEHNDRSASHENFMDRTKRALHRMGEKLRSTTHRDHSETAARDHNDTRSMGAAGDDSARRDRMDKAYNDYQHKLDRREERHEERHETTR